MKKVKWLVSATISATLALMLAACGGPATAATVNGTAIPEQEITDAIEAMRSQTPEYADPAQWASVLNSSGLTPESLREMVIESKARDIILEQEAKAKDITVDTATIDEQIAQTKASVSPDGDEATWTDALKRYGYPTEEDYRKTLTTGELTNKLYEAYTPEPAEGELEEYVVANVASFLASQEANAADSPADGEEGAADPNAAETAEPADVAASTSDYKVPEDGEIVYADIPTDIVTQMEEQWVLANKATKFQEWIDGLVDAADIQINPIPADVPYNVDMTLASSSETEEETATTPTTDTSSPEAVAAALAAGLQITDELVGTGDEAVAGSKVSVLYTGTLEDGTEFDSTAKRDNTPFEFVLGSGSVIKGWDAGVVGMKVGGKRNLVIPAELGYGAQENGLIPANSVLLFSVELVAVAPAS